jgi:L-malate glycosyltransferase
VKIAYLVPESEISGGQRVVFQQAEELAGRGLSVTLVSPSPKPRWFPLEGARWEQSEFRSSPALSEADIRVATFWTTVAPAVDGARGPVFHLCQGYEADLTFYAHRRDEIRRAYSLPTRKLAIAPHIEERLKSEGYRPVAFVGQAFNPDDFPPAKSRRFDAEPPVILLVGTYEADVKGIRETLEALRTARAKGIAYRLHRISTTPPSEEEKALGLAAEHRSGLLPMKMSAAYQASDLLIGPCHPEEGFGLPVLEALSSGLPLLLSDTPCHRHIAREAAVYFRCRDVSDLLAALESVLPDSDRRRRLSEAGQREALRFRTADVVDRLLAEFDRASVRSADR